MTITEVLERDIVTVLGRFVILLSLSAAIATGLKLVVYIIMKLHHNQVNKWN